MTIYYKGFKVVPKGWQQWSKEYPNIELRWVLEVIPHGSLWKIVEGDYSAIFKTKLSQEYLDKRFETWEDAVEEAHELVSTVATCGKFRPQTWPEAKANVESSRWSNPKFYRCAHKDCLHRAVVLCSESKVHNSCNNHDHEVDSDFSI